MFSELLIHLAAPDSLWEITIGPYTDILGNYFFAILLMMALALTYLKSKNFGLVGMMTIIGFSILALYIPGDARTLFMFAIWIGIAAVFYQLVVKVR